MAVMGVVSILAIQALVSVAIFNYFRTHHAADHHWWKTITAPVLAAISQASCCIWRSATSSSSARLQLRQVAVLGRPGHLHRRSRLRVLHEESRPGQVRDGRADDQPGARLGVADGGFAGLGPGVGEVHGTCRPRWPCGHRGRPSTLARAAIRARIRREGTSGPGPTPRPRSTLCGAERARTTIRHAVAAEQVVGVLEGEPVGAPCRAHDRDERRARVRRPSSRASADPGADAPRCAPRPRPAPARSARPAARRSSPTSEWSSRPGNARGGERRALQRDRLAVGQPHPHDLVHEVLGAESERRRGRRRRPRASRSRSPGHRTESPGGAGRTGSPARLVRSRSTLRSATKIPPARPRARRIAPLRCEVGERGAHRRARDAQALGELALGARAARPGSARRRRSARADGRGRRSTAGPERRRGVRGVGPSPGLISWPRGP